MSLPERTCSPKFTAFYSYHHCSSHPGSAAASAASATSAAAAVATEPHTIAQTSLKFIIDHYSFRGGLEIVAILLSQCPQF